MNLGLGLALPTFPLRGGIDQFIRSMFAGGEQGAWYDPSDLSTMFLSSSVSTPITATGQTVGLILDKRLGLAQTSNLVADPDTGTMNPGGTSPPTFSTTTYLGASCRQIVFNPPTGAAGYAVSNAITPNQSNVPATVGALHLELEFSLSRPLTGDEEVWFYAQAPVATYAPGVKAASSAAAVGAWARVSAYQVTSLTSATNMAVYVSGTWSVSAPLTVYVRALTINKALGNHAYQATSASRPVFRDVGGYRYLEFDGVDDYLRATFTIAQPIDRISAIQQVTWTNQEELFSGVSADQCTLYMDDTTPDIRMWGGAFSPAFQPAVGANFVMTERYAGADSRGAVNNDAYIEGTWGTAVPGGITIGASNSGTVPASMHLHQLIERGSTTAMTDAQIAACRALCAIKGGVTL